MIKIDERYILQAYSDMSHVHGYIDSVREQVERFYKNTSCNKDVLEYVLNSYKYMQDWLESGMKELEIFVKDDEE